jgi:hypothetical protein
MIGEAFIKSKVVVMKDDGNGVDYQCFVAHEGAFDAGSWVGKMVSWPRAMRSIMRRQLGRPA